MEYSYSFRKLMFKKKYIFFEVYSMVKHRINFIIITVDIIIIILADTEKKRGGGTKREKTLKIIIIINFEKYINRSTYSE